MSFASYRFTSATLAKMLLKLFSSRTIHGLRARSLLTPASKSNGLDLNGHALGELLDRNAGASGLVREVLLVDGVHLGEVVHGGDEDVDLKGNPTRKQSKAFFEILSPRMKAHLDGTVDAAAGVLEDVLERLAAGLGLVGDAASDEVTLGVGGDLAGDPDLAGGFNGLGLWILLELPLRRLSSCSARDDMHELPGEDLRSVPRLYIQSQQLVL